MSGGSGAVVIISTCVEDTFDRVVSPALGTGPLGPWVTPTIAAGYGNNATDTSFSTDGADAIFDATTASDGDVNEQDLELDPTLGFPIVITYKITATNTPYDGVTDFSIFAFALDVYSTKEFNAASSYSVELFTNPNGSAGFGSFDLGLAINLHPYSGASVLIDIGDANCLANFSGLPFTLVVQIEVDRISAKYWFESVTEPVDYQITLAGSTAAGPLTNVAWFYNGDAGLTSGRIEMHSICIGSGNGGSTVVITGR